MKPSQPGICGLCFHSPGCGVIVHFDAAERIVRLDPDPEAPLGRSRPAYRIMVELAQRLGYGDRFPSHPDVLLSDILADLMLADRKTFALPSSPMVYRKWEKGLLRADGRPGFDTPSGKFEIRSTVLEQFGYDGLPVNEESDETPVRRPDLLRRFPLILGTGPFKPDMKS